MTRIKSISIIGSGNVATHLAKALNNAGINIKSIYSRNIENAKVLGDFVNADFVDEMKNISLDCDLYIISVNDGIVSELAAKLYSQVGSKALVAHTSGMLSSKVFKEYFNDFGVFYPLQTFKKTRRINIEEVPFLITANGYTAKNLLFELGTKISGNVHFINDEKRKALHVAAVFANNFTNLMYRISESITENEEVDFDLLKPLIKETAMKVLDGQKPSSVQTGPAVRSDTNTIKDHLNYLEGNLIAKKIYKLLTKSIIELK